jgi:stage III sporulation protein AB
VLGVIGCILLTAAGAAAGENAVYGLKKHESELGELNGLMSRMDIYLTSCRLDTAELFERISCDNGCYSALFAAAEGDVTCCVSERIRTSGLEMCDALADLIAGFGCTDLEGQLSQNSLLECEVAAALEKAHDRREKYTRIYRAAGVSAGLAAALLLI